LLVRHACIALLHLNTLATPLSQERIAAVCVRLVSVLLSSPLREDGWYSAAEAALKAIYALHPTPAALAAAVLRRLAATAFPSHAGKIDLVQAD
jgi:condensin complex subunit 1